MLSIVKGSNNVTFLVTLSLLRDSFRTTPPNPIGVYQVSQILLPIFKGTQIRLNLLSKWSSNSTRYKKILVVYTNIRQFSCSFALLMIVYMKNIQRSTVQLPYCPELPVDPEVVYVIFFWLPKFETWSFVVSFKNIFYCFEELFFQSSTLQIRYTFFWCNHSINVHSTFWKSKPYRFPSSPWTLCRLTLPRLKGR